MLQVGILIISLGVILSGAELFTNGIEWLGKKLGLSEGAVGSVLAAVGTALPETMIPIMAIFLSNKDSHDIGVGAILGAPFMLGTLALGIAGIAVIVYGKKRLNYPKLNVNLQVIKRDLTFFLIVYSVAIGAAFVPTKWGKWIIAFFLVTAYIIYLIINIREKSTHGELSRIAPLHFSRKKLEPTLKVVLLQLLAGLVLIMTGASIFVDAITMIAVMLKVPTFMLALIIAPVATELPEKFNSIIWIKADKDTLALGNITGAMVFQSSLIPAIGITMTNWQLTPMALSSAVLVLLSVSTIFWQINKKRYLSPYILLLGLLFYIIFIAMIGTKVI